MKLNVQGESSGRKEDTDDPEILSQGGKNGLMKRVNFPPSLCTCPLVTCSTVLGGSVRNPARDKVMQKEA